MSVRSFKLRVLCLFSASALLMSIVSASAQTALEAPYDDRLNRLAEILGSVHYLTNLCSEPTNRWRDQMQTMLSVESPEPNRRARLVASFNRGYRSFGSVYTACTQQARLSNDQFIEEGMALAVEINARYAQ